MINSLDQETVLWGDEAGMYNNERWDYAYSKKGSPILAKKPGQRNLRLSIISFSKQNRFIAPMIFEGYCDRDVVTAYFKEVLLPELKPGMTLVFDNASYHKGGILNKLVAEVGCQLIYLPPYSPDLNPIEKLWSRVKNFARQCLSEGLDLLTSLHNAVKFFSDGLQSE